MLTLMDGWSFLFETFSLNGVQLIGLVGASGAGGFAALRRVIMWEGRDRGRQLVRAKRARRRATKNRATYRALRLLNKHLGGIEAGFYVLKNRVDEMAPEKVADVKGRVDRLANDVGTLRHLLEPLCRGVKTIKAGIKEAPIVAEPDVADLGFLKIAPTPIDDLRCGVWPPRRDGDGFGRSQFRPGEGF